MVASSTAGSRALRVATSKCCQSPNIETENKVLYFLYKVCDYSPDAEIVLGGYLNGLELPVGGNQQCMVSVPFKAL